MKRIVALVLSLLMVFSLAACGSTDSGSTEAAETKAAETEAAETEAAETEAAETEAAETEAAETEAASDDVVEITVWSWDGTIETIIEGFEEENPGIKVNLENAGSSGTEYSAIDNALQAGSGYPDVAHFEYLAMPYYAVQGKLAELSAYGANDLESDFVDAAWSGVHFGDGLYALPLDYGQVAMFYNEATFEKAGITEVPTTWEEYYEAAKKIKALGDEYYITNASLDVFMIMSLMWEAGGQPFINDGNSVKINFEDEGTQKALEYWQKMIDEDLVTNTISNWSDDWNRTLNDGTLATLIIGGWMTAYLEPRAPEQAGNFRVAQMPQWEEGENYSAENGGSCLAILEASEKKEAAYKFLEYVCYGGGTETRVAAGTTLANLHILSDEESLNYEDPYYGGQKVNAVLKEIAESVRVGWQFPVVFQWMREDWNDVLAENVGEDGKADLQAIFELWGQRSIDYANSQGFSASK